MTTTGYAPGFSSSAGVKVRPRTALMPSRVYLNSRTGPTQSYPSYKDFRDRTRTLSGLVGYRIAPVAWTQDGNNAHAWGYEATGNYFQVLAPGAAPRAAGAESAH